MGSVVSRIFGAELIVETLCKTAESSAVQRYKTCRQTCTVSALIYGDIH